MKITLEQLREYIPDGAEFDLVAQDWPDGVEVTPENLSKLSNTRVSFKGPTEDIMDLIGLASEDAQNAFNVAYDDLYSEYDDARNDAVQVYHRVKFAADHKMNGDDRRIALDNAWNTVTTQYNALHEKFTAAIYVALAKELNTQEDHNE